MVKDNKAFLGKFAKNSHAPRRHHHSEKSLEWGLSREHPARVYSFGPFLEETLFSAV
jgi:hypothetical protein